MRGVGGSSLGSLQRVEARAGSRGLANSGDAGGSDINNNYGGCLNYLRDREVLRGWACLGQTELNIRHGEVCFQRVAGGGWDRWLWASVGSAK